MFILEEPYVSDLLARTVAESGLPVLDTPKAREVLDGRGVTLLGDEEFAARYRAATHPRLYANSENAIGWVATHLGDTRLPAMIDICKDKVAFRDLIADMHPGYGYREFSLAHIDEFDPAALAAPFVVKPAVGFFSMGVHVVEDANDWPAVAAELKREAAAFASLYPGEVLAFDRFVAEEVIEGEEYAVDAYFDTAGRVTVVNVYAHLFAGADDVSDRVYLTSSALVGEMAEKLGTYLQDFGDRAGLADFPVHAELRVAQDGSVAAIEVNPMRFGGWCATDLAHFAYGVNPYLCVMEGLAPDWATIDAEHAGEVTALIVSDLPSSFDLATIESVDYEGFSARFSQVLEVRPTDFSRYPVFAFSFVRVRADDLSELHAVLHADLTEHLVLRG